MQNKMCNPWLSIFPVQLTDTQLHKKLLFFMKHKGSSPSSQKLDPDVSQSDPLHTTTTYFLKIHFTYNTYFNYVMNMLLTQ